MDHRLELIHIYHELGLLYGEIVSILAIKHGFIISQRHLRRILFSCNLSRRKNYSNIEEIIVFVSNELKTVGQLHGYRWMYQKIINHGFKVRKEDVRLILSVLDPQGCYLRRTRRLKRRLYSAIGPNYLWHLDGYDKLKPFGLCISGCIDGFSRKIIWLNVYTTNNDPKVIAAYYYEVVKNLGGGPVFLRGDRGTENTIVRNIQTYVFRDGRNGKNTSYLTGTSTANQRIEAFWGHLRKQCIQFWMALFHDLQSQGSFTGSVLDKQLVIFCFIAILQEQLDETAAVWDNHNIRKQQDQPCGKPNIMYEVPELYTTTNCLVPIVFTELETFRSECTFRSVSPCDDDFNELFHLIMNSNNWLVPTTVHQAIKLYLDLRNEALRILDV